ncbi:shieldin complex subunit 2 [Syngnathus typhle]
MSGLRLSEDTWRGEKILQSTFSSKLLNFGHVSAFTCPTDGGLVDAASVSSLCHFLGKRRPPAAVHATTLPSASGTPAVCPPVATWGQHAGPHPIARYAHTYVSAEWRAEAESRRRSALERHAVASVEWANGLKGALLLWGSALDWLPGFRTHLDGVWDVHFLLVMEGSDFERAELHSTPRSHARRLDATDHRLGRFLCVTGRTVEMDVDTLLSQQYSANGIRRQRRASASKHRPHLLSSGDVLLRVRVLAFRFWPYGDMAAALPSSLDGSTPRAAISGMLSGDVTYLGCNRCVAELDVDANGIYAPCYVCLPAGAATTGENWLPPICLRLLQRWPPSAGRLLERLRTLLCLPRKNVAISVRSLVLCDNNGAAISQELALLELLLVPDL